MHPPRLGGVYYRGNDERAPELFNGGYYRTATMEVWLVDREGNRLQWGHEINPDQALSIEYVIERAVGTTPALFTSEIMKSAFLRHHPNFALKDPKRYPLSTNESGTRLASETKNQEMRKPTGQPLNMTADSSQPGSPSAVQTWQARVTLVPFEHWSHGSTDGIIYVRHGANPIDGDRGRAHYGIVYDLQIEDGKIGDRSEIWMGSMYNLNGRVLIPDADHILLDRWFDFRPIPEIEGENTLNPELLGIPEHERR